ncbi:MAG: MbcA/ParS/Xre antitoxin family protein [Rhizobiaceae bacterium]
MLRAADRLGLSLGDLSAVVDVSKPLERLKQNGPSLTGKPYELALLFVRLYRSLDAITGGDDTVARQWLRNKNTALGCIPAERIRSVAGLTDVLAYLDARSRA